jgi:hypothetical protein
MVKTLQFFVYIDNMVTEIFLANHHNLESVYQNL